MLQSIRNTSLLVTACLLLVAGCIDSFNPPEVNSTNSFLVFDGYVNANGTDTSWVRLSRTQRIQDNQPAPYENGASVWVESERGLIYQFQPYQAVRGTYYLPPQSLSFAQNYRVSISLGEKVYQSDWQTFSASPPIDSVTYKVTDESGVQIYVHTHDPLNNTRFYKWTFEETWEYTSPLYSSLEVVNDTIVPRITPIYRCWDDRVATNINIFTTATLSEDIVKYHPIAYVPAASEKLLRTYSILVHQQTLTREGYDYWSELARNNETNGSIFDPFPSQLTGNIRSIDDPSEKVFGFFSGGIRESKRIFIRENLGRSRQCHIAVGDTLTHQEVLLTDKLIYYETDPRGGFIVSTPDCLDCRTRGGTTERPDFWP
jgi:hypothetical protein